MRRKPVPAERVDVEVVGAERRKPWRMMLKKSALSAGEPAPGAIHRALNAETSLLVTYLIMTGGILGADLGV